MASSEDMENRSEVSDEQLTQAVKERRELLDNLRHELEVLKGRREDILVAAVEALGRPEKSEGGSEELRKKDEEIAKLKELLQATEEQEAELEDQIQKRENVREMEKMVSILQELQVDVEVLAQAIAGEGGVRDRRTVEAELEADAEVKQRALEFLDEAREEMRMTAETLERLEVDRRACLSKLFKARADGGALDFGELEVIKEAIEQNEVRYIWNAKHVETVETALKQRESLRFLQDLNDFKLRILACMKTYKRAGGSNGDMAGDRAISAGDEGLDEELASVTRKRSEEMERALKEMEEMEGDFKAKLKETAKAKGAGEKTVTNLRLREYGALKKRLEEAEKIIAVCGNRLRELEGLRRRWQMELEKGEFEYTMNAFGLVVVREDRDDQSKAVLCIDGRNVENESADKRQTVKEELEKMTSSEQVRVNGIQSELDEKNRQKEELLKQAVHLKNEPDRRSFGLKMAIRRFQWEKERIADIEDHLLQAQQHLADLERMLKMVNM